jgi:L-alanine-DL-glutamate epimerase-like enolase superfamily enzyme
MRASALDDERPPATGRHTAPAALAEDPWDAPFVERVDVAVYRVPTDHPEADGTITWNATTLVLTEVSTGGATGLGYAYASGGAAEVIRDVLASAIRGKSATAIGACWVAMQQAVRNIGRPGVAASAISAVDVALWDLKAKLLRVSVAELLGPARKRVPVYGSGGFTSYSDNELVSQLAGWVEQGIPRVKMKIGSEPASDLRRVRAARAAVGEDAELYVDANGAYAVPEALWFAERFVEQRVSWFEEPVSSDELEGLRQLRSRAPAGMAVAAGEYGNDLFYFRRMLEAGAVDVLQADATRCGGISGFLRVSALCEAQGVELSAHTAPLIHLAPAAAAGPLRHVEYFHDHVRIERMLFEGVPEPRNGELCPAWNRPGLGVEFRRLDAEAYRVG